MTAIAAFSLFIGNSFAKPVSNDAKLRNINYKMLMKHWTDNEAYNYPKCTFDKCFRRSIEFHMGVCKELVAELRSLHPKKKTDKDVIKKKIENLTTKYNEVDYIATTLEYKNPADERLSKAYRYAGKGHIDELIAKRVQTIFKAALKYPKRNYKTIVHNSQKYVDAERDIVPNKKVTVRSPRRKVNYKEIVINNTLYISISISVLDTLQLLDKIPGGKALGPLSEVVDLILLPRDIKEWANTAHEDVTAKSFTKDLLGSLGVVGLVKNGYLKPAIQLSKINRDKMDKAIYCFEADDPDYCFDVRTGNR